MTTRALYTFLMLLLLVLGPAWADHSAAPAPMKVRLTGSVTVLGGNFNLFVGFFQCDPAGNVLFVPAPPSSVPPAPPSKGRADVAIRVSADGKTITRLNLKSVPGIGELEDAEILRTAFDPNGNMYVLAAAAGRRHVVSFTKHGRYASIVEIDTKAIHPASFAAFDSGEFFLSGQRPGGLGGVTPRVVVQSVRSGSLRDVALSTDPVIPGVVTPEIRMTLTGEACAEPGADGHVYFARMTPTGPVYAVAPSGRVTREFRLASPKSGARLSSLRASGERLAAVYREEVPDDRGNMVNWIAIYNISSGEHLATYGPVNRLVLCYRSRSGLDRFTLLGAGRAEMELLEATAP